MSAKEELGRYTLDELFGEISCRGEAGVLVLVTKKTPSDQPVRVRAFGGMTHCVGLARYAEVSLIKNLCSREIQDG